MNEAIKWYMEATPEERWDFLFELGGDQVSERVCYMYPENDYKEETLTS